MRRRDAERGLSLVEAMVGIAIALSIGAYVVKNTADSMKAAKQAETVTTLDGYVRSIVSLFREPALLEKTLAANPALKACQDAPAGCRGDSIPLRIMDPVTPGRVLAGPLDDTAPKLNPQGAVCRTGANCALTAFPFEVVAAFDGRPNRVTLSFCIRLREGAPASSWSHAATSPAEASRFPACAAFRDAPPSRRPWLRPNAKQFQPMEFGLPLSLKVSTAENADRATSADSAVTASRANYASRINGGGCGPGDVAVGVNADGRPQCAPLVGLVRQSIATSSFLTGIATGGGGHNGVPQHAIAEVECPAGTVVLGCNCSCGFSAQSTCFAISATRCRAGCEDVYAPSDPIGNHFAHVQARCL